MNRPMREPDVFWTQIKETQEGCWEWQRNKTAGGYGLLRGEGGRYIYAHRHAWELAHGPIPDGLVIDHLCRNRACVNPEHLDPVPQRVNALRGAMSYAGVRNRCKRGHDVTDPANVYVTPKGNHRCRTCAREREDQRTADRRARGDLRKVLRPQCRAGHDMDEKNTHILPDGHRRCRACSAAAARRRRVGVSAR